MRKTPLLQTVVQILKTEARPLSVPMLLTLLPKQGYTPNKTTLYRMLENLAEEGAVQEVVLDSATKYYELQTHHHHHFRCQQCNTIRCISDSALESQIHALEEKLATQGLQVDQHHFSLSGKCDDCL